jgi:hypothetical protein
MAGRANLPDCRHGSPRLHSSTTLYLANWYKNSFERSLPTKIWVSSLDPEKSSCVVVQNVTLLPGS